MKSRDNPAFSFLLVCCDIKTMIEAITMALKNPKKKTDYSSGTPTYCLLLLYKCLIENTNKDIASKREDIFSYFTTFQANKQSKGSVRAQG